MGFSPRPHPHIWARRGRGGVDVLPNALGSARDVRFWGEFFGFDVLVMLFFGGKRKKFF
jgi:hypothetical protein